MNTPPKEFIRVMPQALRSFVAEAFQSVGVPTADAAFLAELLVLTDLRGVFSHGTRELPRYLQMILDGKVNPRPKTSIVDDAAATALATAGETGWKGTGRGTGRADLGVGTDGGEKPCAASLSNGETRAGSTLLDE